MKWTWRDMCALVIITLVVAAFFFRLFLPTSQLLVTPDFGQSDAVSSISTKFFYSREILQHRIPLWMSAIGGGYPIFALGTMATFYLPNLIFFTILPPVIAYNITLVLSVCILGWGMYIWLRLMQYRRTSCVFGSITTVLSGYCITQLTHLTIVQSYSLFPLLAALVLGMANKKSWFTVGWFIILFSQQIFIGFPQCVFITILFILGYWIWLMRIHTDRRQKTLRMIIGLVAGCITAAVQILPSVEYLKTLVTERGFSPAQATLFSYPFKHLITLFNPFSLGNPALGTYPHYTYFRGSIFWENTAYIGIIPLIFLAAYLISLLWKILRHKRRNSNSPNGSVLFFLLVLGISFLLMTGRNSPLYLIYSFWPFNIFRVPSRFIWLFEIALIVLCVCAFDSIIGSFKKTSLVFLTAMTVICLHTLLLFTTWTPYHLLTPASEWLNNPPLAQYIDRSHYLISIGAERMYNQIYKHGWSEYKEIRGASYFLRNTFTPDKNILWHVPHIGDYTGRTIRRSGVLNDLVNQSITTDGGSATISATGHKLLTMLSIKYIVSTLPLTQKGLIHMTSVSYTDHIIDLYKNPDVLPAVYFAKNVVRVYTVEDAAAAFTSDAFIPGNTVLVEFEATPAASLAVGNAEIKLVGEGRYSVGVTNPNKDAILVLTQTYYPGWHATIDSREVPIFPVNIKHIGILVPPGKYIVEFRYRPDSFVYGAWVSSISLGITIFLMAFGYFHDWLHTHQKVPVRASGHQHNHDT